MSPWPASPAARLVGFGQRPFRRADLRGPAHRAGGAYSNPIWSLSGHYAFIQAQPLYGFPDDRREMTVGGSTQVRKNWRLFGSGTYDLEADTLVQDSAGFSYSDECFTYSMTFSQSRDRDTRDTTQSIGFNVSFRTLGDFGTNSSSFGTTQEAEVIVSPHKRGHERPLIWSIGIGNLQGMTSLHAKIVLAAGLAVLMVANAEVPAADAAERAAGRSNMSSTACRSPVTILQRRAAFIKLQRSKQSASESLIEQALHLTEAQRLNIRDHRSAGRRRLREFRQEQQDAGGPARYRPGKVRRDQRAFQGLHPRPDELAAGLGGTRPRRRRAGRPADRAAGGAQDARSGRQQAFGDRIHAAAGDLRGACQRQGSLGKRKNEAEAMRARFTSCDTTRQFAKGLVDVTVRDLGRVLAPELPSDWAELIKASAPAAPRR